MSRNLSMQLAVVYSRANSGIVALPVMVEVHLGPGLPAYSMVGLPEKAVKESKDRIRTAITHSGFQFPLGRLTINLAPADLPKEGGRLDLAIALGILAASGQIETGSLESMEFLGELALSGQLRGSSGVLPAAVACHQVKRSLVAPNTNAEEAALVTGLSVYAAQDLLQVCAHLCGRPHLAVCTAPKVVSVPCEHLDLASVRGQPVARRALEVAAAGGHHMLMMGPPGAGKTMLASRLPGILPPMCDNEALEVATVYSLVSGFNAERWGVRPFRAPHHTSSAVALVGGGRQPRPGEISLAHQGVLFLDELLEYPRQVLDALRQPIESGHITISRAAYQSQFPAQFQLVAAMNPCPCGFYGDPSGRCRCNQEQVLRYQGRLSGPLLDRIDLHVQIEPVRTVDLLHHALEASESSERVRIRVCAARELQIKRSGCANAWLSPACVEEVCCLCTQAKRFMSTAVDRLGLSARAYYRILKVARTLADLEEAASIKKCHLQEAIGYRQFLGSSRPVKH